MQVILLETVSHLGVVGDVINVSPGYARNFLLPKKIAVPASDKNLKIRDHQARVLEHHMKKVRASAEEAKKKIESEGITLTRKSAENGKLFGSVGAMDIENALIEKGIKVSRKRIKLDEPIRKTGSYMIPLKIEGGLETKVKVEVVAEKV